MADLRTRFIEDYAGGLLNIARQELSSTGEVLAQDGFVQGVTLFVEDGRGVKSGLRLGDAVAECVDPTTETGIVNVRSADRTYAKIRDLKAFATAVASAQGALTESVTESFTNLEGAFESLENDVQSYRTQLNELVDSVGLDVGNLTTRTVSLESGLSLTNQTTIALSDRILSLETYITDVENSGVGAGNKGDITVYSTGSGVEWLINTGAVGTNELSNTDVEPGTYRNADITVDSKGRITAAANGTTPAGNKGDITVSPLDGSWKINDDVIGPEQLIDTTVIAGTYSNANITVDAQGRITSASEGSSSLSVSRTSLGVTANFLPSESKNITIPAARTLLLLKVATSSAAWVTLYTDQASRVSDSGRAEGAPYSQNSGIIADIITSDMSLTKVISPGVVAWNNQVPPVPEIYARVVNKNSEATLDITITITYVSVES